jgi:hypothetical protein
MHYRRLRKHGSTTVPQRVNKPGPKPDPSKPYSKHKPPTPRVYEEKTHCPQGHPYDDENTYVDDSGYKHCRTCRRERMAVRRPATLGQGGHNAAKTHCPRGHEYTAENTIRSKDDRRFCRACYNANNPRRVARKYGISVEKVEEMLRDQDDQCAICLVPFDGKTPDIDHDHSCCPGQKACGKCVRGLLCHGCNVGLGYFGDAVVRLRAAISYLESFQQ